MTDALSRLHMVDRVALTQATVDRYRGQAFRWGAADCVRMAAFHLRGFGYNPQLAKGGAYRSANGARAALRRAGFESLAAALDALGLERVAPAAAWVGDIVALPGSEAFNALAVALGGNAILGWHEDAAEATVMRLVEAGTAWRVLPQA